MGWIIFWCWISENQVHFEIENYPDENETSQNMLDEFHGIEIQLKKSFSQYFECPMKEK